LPPWKATARFAALRIANGYLVLDDLTFGGTATVPEPTALALVGAGLLALGARRWRTSCIQANQ
jgi:hypothetical protein